MLKRKNKKYEKNSKKQLIKQLKIIRTNKKFLKKSKKKKEKI